MNSDLQFYRHILILISGFQYKAEVSYRSWLKVISQNISLVHILQIFFVDYITFIGGTKSKKEEDEIILSNDKGAETLEVQVHHSKM